MVVADILRYWYGVEVPRAPRRLQAIILIVADNFSMPLLIKTLFAPWRKDVIPTTGLAIDERLRVFGFNLVSIFVGFFVRLFVLMTASLIIALTVLVGVITLTLWVVIPVLPIVLFFVGIIFLVR